MSDSDRIGLRVAGAVAHLRLNRPDKLNALTAEMVEDLRRHCAAIDRDRSVAVVILSGAGKAFCAGGDIDAWSAENAEAFGRHWVREGHTAFDALARLRQPVIAVLDGHALGGGLELAACADYRIAERQIKLGQPETGLGIIPGWSGTQRAARRFGAQLVRRMAIFGEVFTAEDAMRLGIVDAVAEPGAGYAAAEALADKVLERGTRATELTKMMVNAADGEERERVIESLAGALAAGSDELVEGLAAFRDRRKADFGRRGQE